MFDKNRFLILLLLLVSIFSSCSKEKVKPNILLITIDTLRRDHLGAYGYPRETSPFIDQLAREGLMFKHVITPIPLTAGNHSSILTSLHPLTHNVIMNGSKLNDEVQTIAEVLKKNGYYSIGAIAVGLLTGKKNFSQGFDSFSDKWEKDPGLDTKFPLAERTAQSVNKSLFKQIDEYYHGHKEKPLFIWAHYFDPHGPYYDKDYITFEDKMYKLKYKKQVRRGIKKYDKEIRYTDEHIEKLYKYLEERGITQQLITCVTADHGEQFGEHGYTFGHADFYSENTFVPLIFHGHEIPKNKIVETFVSSMDIGTTLLGRAGLDFEYPIDGIDLLKKSGKPGLFKNRNFLIIGNPLYARSLQLIGEQFSFIMNFDYHYKYWIVSGQNDIPGNRFKPINIKQIKTKGNKKLIALPYTLNQGRNYAVLRADIKKNKGLTVKIKVKPFIYTGKVEVEKIGQLNVIYPVTVLDQVVVHLNLKEGTIIDNLRYAFISKDEFPRNSLFEKKIKNNVYNGLLTLRKKTTDDEFYRLSDDFRMEKNLVYFKKFKPTIQKFKKMIYTAFNYYYQKKNRILKGIKEEKELTPEDKRMLKSLGYL